MPELFKVGEIHWAGSGPSKTAAVHTRSNSGVICDQSWKKKIPQRMRVGEPMEHLGVLKEMRTGRSCVMEKGKDTSGFGPELLLLPDRRHLAAPRAKMLK